MENPDTGLSRPSRLPWIILAIAGILATAGAVRWLTEGDGPGATAESPEPPASPPPSVAETAPVVPTPEPRLVSDALGAISTHPLYRRATQEDVLRRVVTVADDLSEGVSPRAQLTFLRPHRKFTVERNSGELVIARASYARYDGFADAVASVDAGALAKAYRSLHGPLEDAYRALGYPRASLDGVVARALRRVAEAPAREGRVAVVDEGGGVFTFKDPALEGLGPVEKHLLRMGPRNTRAIQTKAREILSALALPTDVLGEREQRPNR